MKRRLPIIFPDKTLVVTSRGIWATPTLSALFPEVRLTQHPLAADNTSYVLAWGRKPSARKAEALAQKQGLPLLRVEDGFLRSIGIGSDDPPLSLVLDDLGIYYDASTASRLEGLIGEALLPAQVGEAQHLIGLWRAHRVSKYNHARDAGSPEAPYVLVVDQTAGDASIAYGLADAASFTRMLESALANHPQHRIVLKVHPEVFAGRKCGHFDLAALKANSRVEVLAENQHPAPLIAHADAIYTVTSQMGFEALLWGRPVHCFGMPFYAGWGLTDDALPAPARRGKATLEQLAHAALLRYPRYLDPERNELCDIYRLIYWIALQRRMRGRFPERIEAVGFSRWKQPILTRFFDGSTLRFSKSRVRRRDAEAVAVWGNKEPQELPAGASVLRVEDGFLRSVGLGAELTRPLSWVIDDVGIYYDATRPSRLEQILSKQDFGFELLARAAALRESLCQHGLTKYNLTGKRWQRPPEAKSVALVVGQVESDASLKWGAPGIRTNMELLREVRAARPDAWLLYKPHPDVVAGLRRRGKEEDSAKRWCDEIVTDAPMSELLEAVDEVHVLTSLAGFEALLRGRPVFTYGLPFYAGWGLTQDVLSTPRRTRRLTLDELVAGTLIEYPTYVSLTTGRFTTPERALEELLEWRSRGPGRLPLWRRAWRAMLAGYARVTKRDEQV